MGVNIKELVNFEEISWEQLEGKIIGVDASLTLYQFLTSIRQRDGTPLMDKQGNITSHLVGLFSRVTALMEKGLKLCFVFDGKPPELKSEQNRLRKERKEEAKGKFEQAKEKGEEKEMLKYARQVTYLNSEMVEEAKELISALGLPVIQAPSEAEAQCAHMCKKKLVWAVGSQDFDTLIFGSPRMVRNLTISTKKKTSSGAYVPYLPEVVELSLVLNELGLDRDQLIVLAILIGTDYNPKGVLGIGPKKALDLVQSGKKFEEIFKDLEVDFDWKEIFDTIKNMPVKGVELEWKEMDVGKLREILIERHDFSQDRFDNAIKKLVKENNPQKGLNDWI